MSHLKSIEFPKAYLQLLEEGLILLRFKDNVVIELEDAKKIDELIVDQLTGNKCFVALIDGRDIRSSITHEARDFFAKDPLVLEIRKAQALVVNNLHTKLLANFYMRFHKPENPIKVFSNYNKAEKWVKEILSEYKK